MLFTANEFLFLFLPIVLFGFFALAKINRTVATVWLTVASLFFYSWWNIAFLPLLLFSAAINYSNGLLISRSHSRHLAKLSLVVGICVNIGLLGYFKYVNFFIDTINVALDTKLDYLTMVLPLGISFFTFTQIAFLIDVYKGAVKEYRFIHYLLFVTYFPHLIAGPILHHKQMMPQFASPKTYSLQAENFATGLSLFVLGLTKKVLIADGFNQYVTPVFNAANHGLPLTAITAWTGALAYSFQLYFDFSGYSDMAIGLSRLFGIHLPINFYSPYQSVNIIEFWRRWHITLSQFLRDYLYVPLGGNRHGTARRYLNLMITMLLGGLWHGANWTFVFWGGLHGFFLVLNHGWQAICSRFTFLKQISHRTTALNIIITFLLVTIAWVFFRADNFSTACNILAGMLGLHGLSLSHGNLWHGAINGFCQLFDKQIITLQTIDQGYFIVPFAIGSGIIWCLPNSIKLFEKTTTQGLQSMLTSPPLKIAWRPSFLWAFFTMMLLSIDFIKNFGVNLPPSPFLYFQF